MAWQLAEAKNKFSEVFSRAMEEGPQFVTRRDEEVVVLSKETYERLTGTRQNFLEFLMSGPGLDGVDLERDSRPLRDIDW